MECPNFSDVPCVWLHGVWACCVWLVPESGLVKGQPCCACVRCVPASGWRHCMHAGSSTFYITVVAWSAAAFSIVASQRPVQPPLPPVTYLAPGIPQFGCVSCCAKLPLGACLRGSLGHFAHALRVREPLCLCG